MPARARRAKGAVVVTVKDGEVAAVEHRPLDVIRWAAGTGERGELARGAPVGIGQRVAPIRVGLPLLPHQWAR
jgi:hypothetical protein